MRALVLHPHEVRAALRGEVLVVRAVRPQPIGGPWYDDEDRVWRDCWEVWPVGSKLGPTHEETPVLPCPLGSPGERRAVKETWGLVWPDGCLVGWVPDPAAPDGERRLRDEECRVEYRADLPAGCTDLPGHWPQECREDPDATSWRSPVTMPAWASRLTVDVASVECRRVSTISEEEAALAGCEARLPFAVLWDSSARAGARWDDDPWCWFVRVRPVGVEP